VTRGRVLIVAGSDSGGGAGIQADVKTVTALGGYAATAITALTAQNTQGVFGILDVPADFVARQMRVVLEDIGADCIKLGMLHRSDIIDAVLQVLAEAAPDVPVVVDPVMIAKGGQSLLTVAAMESLRLWLVPRATVLTPNLPEALALLDEADAVAPPERLAERLLVLGPRAVLLKGGHGEGPVLIDVLAEHDRPPERFHGARLETPHTHGTGCTLASAVACGLAQGLPLRRAVIRARAYVRAAIEAAPGFGRGHGPLGHGHTLRLFQAGD
jgi:hydroxymethylpyrimidine/phosphomethylpyrimidine kinase